MGDILFFLLLTGGGALALAAAYITFNLFNFTLNKITGGRLDLISFIEKL
jgi:hypothetical protein